MIYVWNLRFIFINNCFNLLFDLFLIFLKSISGIYFELAYFIYPCLLVLLIKLDHNCVNIFDEFIKLVPC